MLMSADNKYKFGWFVKLYRYFRNTRCQISGGNSGLLELVIWKYSVYTSYATSGAEDTLIRPEFSRHFPGSRNIAARKLLVLLCCYACVGAWDYRTSRYIQT